MPLTTRELTGSVRRGGGALEIQHGHRSMTVESYHANGPCFCRLQRCLHLACMELCQGRGESIPDEPYGHLGTVCGESQKNQPT